MTFPWVRCIGASAGIGAESVMKTVWNGFDRRTSQDLSSYSRARRTISRPWTQDTGKVRGERTSDPTGNRSVQVRAARVHPVSKTRSSPTNPSRLTAGLSTARGLSRRYMPWRRLERLARIPAVTTADLRVVVPPTRDRQSIGGCRSNRGGAVVPRRAELHLVREASQVVPEFELLQIPCVGGDEFDRLREREKKADRRLCWIGSVCSRAPRFRSSSSPSPGRLDLQAFRNVAASRHCGRIRRSLDRLEAEFAEQLPGRHVAVRADHRPRRSRTRPSHRMRDDRTSRSYRGIRAFFPCSPLYLASSGGPITAWQAARALPGRRDMDVAPERDRLHPDEGGRPVS